MGQIQTKFNDDIFEFNKIEIDQLLFIPAYSNSRKYKGQEYEKPQSMLSIVYESQKDFCLMKANEIMNKNYYQEAQFFDQKLQEEQTKEKKTLDKIKNKYLEFAQTHKKLVENELVDFLQAIIDLKKLVYKNLRYFQTYQIIQEQVDIAAKHITESKNIVFKYNQEIEKIENEIPNAYSEEFYEQKIKEKKDLISTCIKQIQQLYIFEEFALPVKVKQLKQNIQELRMFLKEEKQRYFKVILSYRESYALQQYIFKKMQMQSIDQMKEVGCHPMKDQTNIKLHCWQNEWFVKNIDIFKSNQLHIEKHNFKQKFDLRKEIQVNNIELYLNEEGKADYIDYKIFDQLVYELSQYCPEIDQIQAFDYQLFNIDPKTKVELISYDYDENNSDEISSDEC